MMMHVCHAIFMTESHLILPTSTVVDRDQNSRFAYGAGGEEGWMKALRRALSDVNIIMEFDFVSVWIPPHC